MSTKNKGQDSRGKKRQKRAQVIAFILALLMVSSIVIMFVQSLSY